MNTGVAFQCILIIRRRFKLDNVENWAEQKCRPPWLMYKKKIEIILAKTLWNSPKKQNLDLKINDSKPHIWLLSMNFRFSGRKPHSQQNLAKNITHFTTQFASKTSLILRILTHSQLTAKNLTPHSTNFPANMFMIRVRKKINYTISRPTF